MVERPSYTDAVVRFDRDLEMVKQTVTEHSVEIRQLKAGQETLAKRIDANSQRVHDDIQSLLVRSDKNFEKIHEKLDSSVKWVVGLIVSAILGIGGWVVTHI